MREFLYQHRIAPLMLAMIVAVGCHRQKPAFGLGYEWLSWSAEQRSTFVIGFISGRSIGSWETCEAIDASIHGGAKIPPGTLIPGDECKAARKIYSRGNLTWGDVSPYTTAIDQFYKHPECRMMPYTVLLEHLNDKEYLSGEDLFKLVHHGHANWGSFSGFPEMRKCYP